MRFCLFFVVMIRHIWYNEETICLGGLEMKKIDKISTIFNIVLGVLYVPLSFFCLLLQMASDGTVGATNPLYIQMNRIFCMAVLTVPFFCVAGIILSIVFRKKGWHVWSFIIQFLPIVVFGLDLVFLGFTNYIPRMM